MDRDRRLSLDEVLQQLGADAQDVFVSHLRKDYSLKAARLACSTLRKVVDRGVREADIEVQQTDLESWEAGSRPPLHRWPRLSKLIIAAEPSVPADQMGTLLPLPLAQLPLEARQRIISVALGDYRHTCYTGAAVALVLYRLPCLRHVAIRASLPDALPEQQQVGDALVSLPDLEDLALEPGPVLEVILEASVQGSRLRTLELYSLCGRLNDRMAAGIGRLQQLQNLTVYSPTNKEVRKLLGALPPNLCVLQLPQCVGLELTDAELHVEGGSVTSIKCADEVSLEDLCLFVAEALVPSGTLARRLERISLEAVRIYGGSCGKYWHHLQRLSELLQHCACTEVKTTYIDYGVPASLAENGLALLGNSVRAFKLCYPESSSQPYLHLRLPPRQPATPMAGNNQAGAAASSREPSLVDLALQRLFGSTGSAAGIGGCTASAGAAGSIVTLEHAFVTPLDRRQPSCLSLLLLRRPLQHPGHPGECGAADAWVRRWAGQAVEAAALARGSSAWVLTKEVARFLPLPYPAMSAASGMLVQFRTAADLAVASAAARLVVEAEAACVGDAAAAEAAQVASVVVSLTHNWESGAADTLMCAMEQAAQSVLDGEGVGAVWSAQRRLRWLLEQWERVRELRVLSTFELP